MGISNASGSWDGTIKQGKGVMKPDNGPEVPFSMATRFEGAKGSNPEEMIGAALSGCFSMALSLALEKAGMTPQSIRSTAKVHLDKEGDGFSIKKIELTTDVNASGGDDAKFQAVAAETKKQCPVSKVLKAEITLTAKLAG
jgi:osmotically inducible protein OsmC